MSYNIYLITNIENKKQYVGITKFSITERFYQHSKRGFLLTEAIKKYGEDKFFIELILDDFKRNHYLTFNYSVI
jgi:predicted GIY-YIG superfamily endonuclease